MTAPHMLTVRAHADAVFRRATEPIEPPGFKPNWRDHPSLYKTYPNAPLIALPDVQPVGERAFAAALAEPVPPVPAGYSVEKLAWLLRMSYGVLGRRMRVNWNQDAAERMRYPTAAWSRGTANGGGLYPLELYWVCGGTDHLQPGIYHYATGHHALERLATGSFTDRVREAAGHHPDTAQTDQFLLVSVRFWKNSYKYSNFSYHVITQDVGALLGSWDLLGAGLALPVRRIMWYDDEPLNRMLGLDTAEESVLAIVPLRWAGETAPAGGAQPFPGLPDAGDGPGVTTAAYERSRDVVRFPDLERVHRATLLADAARPQTSVAHRAAIDSPPPEGTPGVALPPELTGRLSETVTDLLARRSSSFGNLTAVPPLEAAELATVLAAGTRTYGRRSDLTPDTEPVTWTRLSVFANHVGGVPPGCYRYDPDAHVLYPTEPGVPTGRLSTFLYRNYFTWLNYNLEQVAAVIAISGRLGTMLSTYGGRGYRILNAEAGSVAQTVYLTATALGIGCGANLGFDHVAMSAALGFDGDDERTLLFMLIGRERPGRADFDLPLRFGDEEP